MIEVGPLRVFLKDRTVLLAGQPCPLNNRAFAILEALIKSRGTVVGKDALLAHAWPDTIVEENNLQVHIVTLRRALGEARDLLRTISGRGYMLLPQPEAQPRRNKVYSLGLPLVDTLFGRDDAVDQLLHLFSSHQVVTLTGAGGIGKTSLAIELCRDTGDRFNCIRYVSFAPIRNDREAREAILAIFADVVQGSAISVEEMAKSLRKARCLVVLDNCEHLIDTAACIAQTITAGNAGVRVLATSREALRIAAEAIYPVPTLSVPDAAMGMDATLASDAVKLLLHRLRRQSAQFDLNAATVVVMGEICRRLDGIPLAIELAAARAATLGLDAVRAHLDDRFMILTGGSRDALPRHQTLRAVFEWSYRLLSPAEQQLFRQASVFADGFSLDAISALMRSHEMSTVATAETLAGLVAKSLIYIDRQNARRFRLLESARAYAHALLDANGEADDASRAHAVYFRDLFEKGPYKSEHIRIEDAHDVIDEEIGNMRAAMSWAFGNGSNGGDVGLGIALAATAIPILFELPRFDECDHWSTIALKALSGAQSIQHAQQTRLRILSASAAARVYTEGPLPAIEMAWHDTLALADACDDNGQRLRAIWGLWNVELYAGRPKTALTWAFEFQKAAHAYGSPLQAALSRRLVGLTLHYAGQHAEAREELLGALGTPAMKELRWSTPGVRTDQISATHAMLARIQWFLGDREAIPQQLEVAEDAARMAGHELTLAYVLIEASIPLAIMQRRADVLMRAVQGLEQECRKAGLYAWLACCDALEWIAHAMERTLSIAELGDMEAAIQRLRATAYLAPLPMVLGEFAGALLAAGEQQRATDTLDAALAYCATHGNVWYLPELERACAAIAPQADPAECSAIPLVQG